MKKRMRFSLGALSLLLSCSPVWAAVNGWVVVKTALYEQTADNMQPTQADTWNFYIHVEGDAASIVLTGPGLGAGLAMTQVEPESWELGIDYPGKAALDAAFPAGGTFTLTASGGIGGTLVQSFTIPSDAYPQVPYLTGNVYTGFQSLNVYQPYPMTWNSYSGGPDILTIFPESGGYWVVEEDVDDSYILSAGTLEDNSGYIGHLEFFAVSSLPADDFSGGAFRFISLTQYTIHTETPKKIVDDFNDNVRNTNVWSEVLDEPERYLAEQNGRLEAISTAGVYANDTGVWEWTGPKAAFDQNWTVTFDATINVTETSPGSSSWIGFVAADPTLSSTAVVEQWVQDGARGVDAAAKVNGVDLGEENAFITSQTVTLRMNYDSGKKELHASYDDGGGYWNFLASLSVSDWGMTDTNNFRILIFGGSEVDGLVSGDAYGDNFTFEINNVESDPEVVIPCESIVGSWYIKDKDRPSHDNVILSFLTNGIYFMCQDGDLSTEPPGAVGYDGMEMGTYTWDQVTQQLSNVVLEDTNAQWGLSDDPATNIPFEVEGNKIYVGDRDVDPFILHRVIAQTSPASLVGSWVVGDDEVVITFLHNGIYYLSHSDVGADATGWPGMERGIYTWDSGTGAFTAMALVDTTGDWGLDGGSPEAGMTILVDGNTAHFTIPSDATEFDMFRVIAPDCSDLDADGLPDAFEMQISGNPTNAVPEGNSDGDDLTDREEFIAGTLPGDGASVFVVSNAPPLPAGHVLTWNAIENRIYTVEWTDDLSAGFQTLESGIAYPQNNYTDTVHSADNGGFYNLKVELED